MKRQKAERRGREGEAQAAAWLRLKGWSILDTRVKTPAGEIDLVARRGKQIAFVEVKWRAKKSEPILPSTNTACAALPLPPNAWRTTMRNGARTSAWT